MFVKHNLSYRFDTTLSTPNDNISDTEFMLHFISIYRDLLMLWRIKSAFFLWTKIREAWQ